MRTLLASLVLLSLTLLPGRAEAAIELETVVSGLGAPVAVTATPGDDRLFVTVIGGVVQIIENGQLLPEPFLDIAIRVSGEGGRGLWSVAFHPDYPAVPWLFAHYVERDTGDSIISRFSLGQDGLMDPSSELILLRMPKAVQLHYGGLVAFGPDGYLYISTGDGTDGAVGPDPLCLSQKLDSLEGKMLRIDVNVENGFRIPPDNPFVGTTGEAIWSYGLRNPWRFGFDHETGDLWISDVGENGREEINRQPASSAGGENYGWKIMEGTSCFSNLTGCGLAPPCGDPAFTMPSIDYGHAQGRCSVIGGTVYRGSLAPDLYGRYVYGDFCSGEVWAVDAEAPSFAGSELIASIPFLASFGEGADGELYAIGGDSVFRFVDPAVTAAGVAEFTVTGAEVAEAAGQLTVEVRRVGGTEGAVSVDASTLQGTAVAGGDFVSTVTTLTWADGEAGTKTFTVPLIDDVELEAAESFELVLGNPQGGLRVGSRGVVAAVIADDDNACVSSNTVLCLNDERFRVRIDWQTEDNAGAARAVPLTVDAGFFWFFAEDNPEIFVKILNACAPPFNRFWVFIAGLTNVGTEIEVTDLESGEIRRYGTQVGQGFEAIRDTDAFATCP